MFCVTPDAVVTAALTEDRYDVDEGATAVVCVVLNGTMERTVTVILTVRDRNATSEYWQRELLVKAEFLALQTSHGSDQYACSVSTIYVQCKFSSASMHVHLQVVW